MFCYTSQLKIEQYTDKNYLLDVGWRTDLPPFQRCTTWSRESKVQVVVALGRHEVLFALGLHEVLTNDTWHVLLQSENVFELGGITKEFKKRRRLRQRQRQKVKRIKMLVLHFRHAFLNISLPYSSKLLREMTKFKVLTTTWTNYRESFSLTLYFKSVCTNPVLGHFNHIE